MNVLVILQARMASTRLAGKVLLPLGGWPLIDWPIRRLAGIGDVVLATSSNATDDPLAAHVDVPVVRGSEEDVLGRFLGASQQFPDHPLIVRATGDNPLVLPELAESAIATLQREQADYCSIEGSALGTTVEVLTRETLRKIASLSTDPEEREHLTLGILRRPTQFRIARFQAPVEYRSDLRLTIDTPEDYAWMQTLIASIGLPLELIAWEQIVNASREVPPREFIHEQRGLSEVQRLKEIAWQTN